MGPKRCYHGATGTNSGAVQKPWCGSSLLNCWNRPTRRRRTATPPWRERSGQAAGFLHTELGPYYEDDPPLVLYLGDYDKAGDDIEGNTRETLQKYWGPIPDENWVRLAVVEDQIPILKRRGVKPIPKIDRRHKPPLEYDAWETEAFSQSSIVKLVRDKLEELLPEPLADVLERQTLERVEAQRRLARWK